MSSGVYGGKIKRLVLLTMVLVSRMIHFQNVTGYTVLVMEMVSGSGNIHNVSKRVAEEVSL